MTKGKITLRLLSVIAVAFMAAAVSIILLVNYQTKRIVDSSQTAVYSEKLDSILETLTRKYERLQLTGMPETFEEDFKESAIKALRQIYYKTSGQQIYPFISGADGSTIMHPDYQYGDRSFANTDFMTRALELKTGEFHYTYKNHVRKWTIFKHFKQWDWIVGFTIPLDVKYADVGKLRNSLLFTMTVITLLVLAILSIIITRLTKPITDLTNISSEIAAGNLEQEINVRGTDEVGILADSFERMRLSIQKMLSDLENKNKELSGEIKERKRFEESLKESEETARALLNATTDSVLLMDSDGIIMSVNESMSERLGKSDEVLIGTNIYDHLPTDIAEQRKKIALEAAKKHKPVQFEDRRGDRWLENNVFPIFNPRGDVNRYAIYSRDITDQKKTEESLRLTQYSVDHSSDAVFWILPDANIVYVNDTVCGLLGYSQQELLTMTVLDIDPDSDPDKLLRRFEEIEKSGSLIFETRLRRNDGYVFPVEIMVNKRELEGKPYIFAFARDITERKKAELDLIESESKYHMLFESANDAIFIMKDDLFIDCNEKTLELFGCTKAQIIHHSPYGLSPHLQPDDSISQEKALEKLEKAYNGNPQFFEWKHKKFDGTLFDAEISLNAIDFGSERYLQAIVRDITERKKAEEDLSRAKSLLFEAIEQSPAGIIIADAPDVKITIANSAALGIRGETSESLTDIPVDLHPAKWQTFYPDGTPFKPEDLPLSQAVMLGIKSNNVDAIIRRQNGEDRWVLANAAPVRDEKGAIVAGVVVFHDITELKKTEDALRKSEEQLRHAQKMEAVGQLAGGIAHDFNNVLTAIIGFANLIKMKLKGNDEIIQDVDYIISSANRAAYLTQSLLTFSRKQIINPQPLKINEVIQNLNRLLMRILGEDIELQTLLTEDDPTIRADSVQIDQVLMNLSTNARDAMPNGGKLSIITESINLDSEFIKAHGYGTQGMYVLISVADSGTGMNSETKSKIFEPFFTTKEVGEGTGLGMSVLYGIVKQHNGFVDVYSEQGEGTTIKIYFPTISSDVKQADAIKSMLKRGSETVLVAEDDEMARLLVRTVLEEYGYTVIVAENGEDAIESYIQNQEEIQLLLLDVIMPKKNGKEVFEEIKKIRPDIKALFTSGYPKDIIQKREILDKKLNFIPKPLSPQQLLLKIREVLDQ